MKKFVLVLLLSFLSLAFGDPAPFGLELGKATFSQVAKKYPSYGRGENRISHLNGKMIYVNANEFELEGIINKVQMAFDDKDILHGLTFEMHKDKFDSIYNSLRQKYKLVKSEIPFVGDKYAEFKNGNSLVKLTAPHLDFDMDVIYLTEKYDKAWINYLKEQEQAKKQKQNSLL